MRGMSYDSTAQTLQHIQVVRDGIGRAIRELVHRSEVHDLTKMGPNEKPVFDEFTPKLKGSTYGSEEYKGYLKEMGKALEHHYASHRHHPEHFGEAGIRGMNLIDLLEMVIDWNAATKRHDDGDIYRSIGLNQDRFGYSDELRQILKNTADWIKQSESEGS